MSWKKNTNPTYLVESSNINEGKMANLAAAFLTILSSNANAGMFDKENLESLATKLAASATSMANQASGYTADQLLAMSRKAADISPLEAMISNVRRALTGESIFDEIVANTAIATTKLGKLIGSAGKEVIDALNDQAEQAHAAELKLYKKYKNIYTEEKFFEIAHQASAEIEEKLQTTQEYKNMTTSGSISALRSNSQAYINKWISMLDQHIAAQQSSK
jgi:hypothetical protein